MGKRKATAANDHVPSALGLEDLPIELLHRVIELLPYDDLSSLARTCQYLRQHCLVPLRYRIVDFRLIDGRLRPSKPNTKVEQCAEGFRYIHWPPRFDATKLAQQQQKFTAKMLEDPRAAAWVRELHWTIRNHQPAAGDYDDRMWEFFESMRNVRKVDLECYQETWNWKYLRSPPATLFPKATDIRLSGVMYRETVMAVLSPARLEHLTLDSLQDPGMWMAEQPFNAVKAYRPEDYVDNDTTRVPGPMRGILPLLVNKCPNLISFKCRRPGWTMSRRNSNNAYDETIYIEIADFITSVSETIEEFTLEHGIDQAKMDRYRTGTLHQSVQFVTGKKMPMDSMMEQHIWPALRSRQWPALRKVRLTVGYWKGARGINFGNISALRKHLGPTVGLKVVDIDDRPCELFRGS